MFVSNLIYYAMTVATLLPWNAHAQIKFDDVYNSCGNPTDVNTGGAAMFADIINMAKSSGSYMDKAKSGQFKSWDYFAIISAFNAFFDATQPDADTRWLTVRKNLQTIEDIPLNEPPVWISCDDTTLFFRETDGRQYFKDPHNKAKTYMPTPVLLCADPVISNGQQNYQIAYRCQIPGTGGNLIVICKDNSQVPSSSVLSQLNFKVGDDLFNQQTLSTIIFHELTHVIQSMRSKFQVVLDLSSILIRAYLTTLIVRGDSSGGLIPDGERYGWAGVMEVRSTYSIRNPENLVFFAKALSMEEYLWHTGKAETARDIYAQAVKPGNQAGQHLIQNFGLTQPPKT